MPSTKSSADPLDPYVIALSIGSGEQVYLKRGLASLARNSHPAAPIVLIHEEAVEVCERDLVGYDGARDRKIVLGSAVPAGSSSLHQAIRLHRASYRDRDLLFLRCGVDVPLGWDQRLRFIAYQDSRIGTLSPLCDCSALFRLLSESTTADVDRVDALLCRFARGESKEVPTFLEGCVYIKGEVLDAVDESEIGGDATKAGSDAITFSRAVRLSGYAHSLCDCVYAHQHSRDAAQANLEQAYFQDVEAVTARHPLTGLRHTLNDALRQGIEGDLSAGRPAQLHIMHGWGGGLERWVRDFVAHDRSRKNYILKAVGNWGQFGQRIELYDSPSMDAPIRIWELQFPIKSLALVNLQYRRAIVEILDEYGIEAILVSSLIGHSLDVLDLPVETLLIFHDYLPFCPALNIYFEGVCEDCDQSRLGRCFAENEFNCFFTNVTAPEWLDIRRRFLALVTKRGLRIVVPTESVERHWKRLAPELFDAEFHHIPHGVGAIERVECGKRAPNATKLRVLVLGSLAPQKGGRLLQETLPQLLDVADFLLLGCGEGGAFFSKYPEIDIVPSYRPEELERIVAGFDPDLGLLASIVPETYSYTLSELIGLGIPPMAPKRGSFSDRIVDGQTGLLYEPEAQVLQHGIRAIAADRGKLEALRSDLRTLPFSTEEEMVDAYHRLIKLPRFSLARCPQSLAPAAPMPLLFVDPNARFVDACREFGAYSQRKLLASTRLRPWQKRLLGRLLVVLFRPGRRMKRDTQEPP